MGIMRSRPETAPSGRASSIAVVAVWDVVWKGLALWQAAKRRQPVWFVAPAVPEHRRRAPDRLPGDDAGVRDAAKDQEAWDAQYSQDSRRLRGRLTGDPGDA